MRVRVEMLGLSRLVTGTREVSLEMADQATYRDLVYALSETYPGLVDEYGDLDGDGILNFVEYAFVQQPTSVIAGEPFAIQTAMRHADSSVSYVVGLSPDLSAW